MKNSMEFSASGAKKIMWDVSGAFGDIGILFPIAIALIAKNGFNPSALFLAAGLFYIASAYYFRITMPVQPLKAMAAIAIATGLSSSIINSAGIIMGVILIFIAVTGLSVKLGRTFPISVIRGIQLGLGLLLIKTSFSFISVDPSIALISGSMLILTITVFKRMPPLIPLLIIGIVVVLMKIDALPLGMVALTPEFPELSNLWPAFILLVFPQVALTFGNAIVATEATGKMLLNDRAEKLDFRSIPMSMGLANIFAGFLGGAPMCHGSGGLTAHYKFGARDRHSGYIIGLTLIVLAIVFGNSALTLISVFPQGLLGIMLCSVGIQHAFLVRDILTDKLSVFIALSVAATGLVTSNLSIGFLIGLVIHYSLMGIMKRIRLFEQ
jgi:sulfate permease, SulP family